MLAKADILIVGLHPGSWLIALRALSPLRNKLASTKNRKVTGRL